MNKTSIIIRREYLTRVRKKSFILMTFLGPVLFAAMMVLPVWFATMEDEDVKLIAVLDSSQLFLKKIPETAFFKFEYSRDVDRSYLEEFKKNLWKTDYFGILYIPHYIIEIPQGLEFYSHKQAPGNLTRHLTHTIEKEIERLKLKEYNIENLDNILHAVKTRVDIRTFKLSESGEQKESHSYLNMAVAYISAFMIYLFIFLFGSQVMRGVIEEKASRIVEVIVSSVKPFQLLTGKVVGVALVGLTQFLAWVVLTLLLVVAAQGVFLPDIAGEALQLGTALQLPLNTDDLVQPSATTETAREILNMIQSINFGLLIVCFLFFFIGGYLLYGSLFAAIGSAADTEVDTQQFMLPVSIPLIIAIMVMIQAMQNPDGALAFWFSIIPLTSPVVMMARIPFGVPYGELALAAALLILAFVGTIWLSAKIYRTGILIYGKKLTYRELWKWLTYKN